MIVLKITCAFFKRACEKTPVENVAHAHVHTAYTSINLLFLFACPPYTGMLLFYLNSQAP